jgi:hypothetical protein
VQLRCCDGNIHYSFDGLVIVKVQSQPSSLKSLDSLVFAASNGRHRSRPLPHSSLSLLEPTSPLRFHCLFPSSDRPKIGHLQSPWRSTVQPSTDARCFPAIGAANLTVLTIFLTFSSPCVASINCETLFPQHAISTGLMAETRIQQHHLSPASSSSRPTFMPDACPPRPRFVAVLRYKR